MQTSEMDHRAWQTTSINLDIINPMTLFCFILLFQNRISLYNPAGLKVKSCQKVLRWLGSKGACHGDLSLNPRLMPTREPIQQAAL